MKAIFDSTLTVSMPKEALVLSSGDSQVGARQDSFVAAWA